MVHTGCQSRNKGGVGQVNGSYRLSVKEQGWGWTSEWFIQSVKDQGWGWTGEWFLQAVSQGPRVVHTDGQSTKVGWALPSE